MALTNDELHRLHEIEEGLRLDAPRLEAMMRPGRARMKAGGIGRVLLAAALVTLLVGSLSTQPVVCVAAWLALLVAAFVLAWDCSRAVNAADRAAGREDR